MKWVCRRFLTAFSSEDILNHHNDTCQKQQPTNITFSWKDHLKFEDNFMEIPLPIRVYADFECIIQPTQNTAKLVLPDPRVLFKRSPIAVGLYLISPYGPHFGNQYYSYFGVDCVTWVVNEMLTLEKLASECFGTNIPLGMTPEEEESFQQSTICWLCENPFGDDTVRDHDHLTGKYRGAAHNRCNLKKVIKFCSHIFLGKIVILYLNK